MDIKYLRPLEFRFNSKANLAIRFSMMIILSMLLNACSGQRPGDDTLTEEPGKAQVTEETEVAQVIEGSEEPQDHVEPQEALILIERVEIETVVAGSLPFFSAQVYGKITNSCALIEKVPGAITQDIFDHSISLKINPTYQNDGDCQQISEPLFLGIGIDTKGLPGGDYEKPPGKLIALQCYYFSSGHS